MGLEVTCPAPELFTDPGFDNPAAWILTNDAQIVGSHLEIGLLEGLSGQCKQSIEARTGELYLFEWEIDFNIGGPAEGIVVMMGTGGAAVVVDSKSLVGVYSAFVTSPDNTGLIEIKSFPGFDDNRTKIPQVSMKLYSNVVACDLDLELPPGTYSQSWPLAGNKMMFRFVNEQYSMNNLYIVEY